MFTGRLSIMRQPLAPGEEGLDPRDQQRQEAQTGRPRQGLIAGSLGAQKPGC